jgi:hypothetical protein
MKNNINEVISSDYIFFARQRAKRRKSPWNLILIPLSGIGIATSMFLMWKLIFSLQLFLLPSERILFGNTRIGLILIMVSILFPALGIGLMFGNLIAWLILPLRRIFDREAIGYPGTSFKEAMRDLSRLTLWMSGIVLPPLLLGALNYFYVTEKGVHYNPLFSLFERHYDWKDIEEIHTRCLAERDNLHLNFKLVMSDHTKIDLMEETRLDFVRVYPEIKFFLDRKPNIQYKREIDKKGVKRLNGRYTQENAREILHILQGQIEQSEMQ